MLILIKERQSLINIYTVKYIDQITKSNIMISKYKHIKYFYKI